jgi:allantoate deiminase
MLDVMTCCDRLNECSEEPGCLTRRYGTEALRRAQELVAGWMREAGLETRRDAAGNLIGRRASGKANAKTLLLGSHLDSVRDGGRYDGPVGVLTAIAALDSLREADLPFDVEVCAFADEEGLRFHTAYLGSAALVGGLDAATLDMRDRDGVSIVEAMRQFGGNPDDLPSAERDPASLIGWIEAHIEQGPVLEARGLPVGVVTDIIGASKAAIVFTGTAGHAGTVPMAMRRDALTAAAEFALAVERVGRETPGLVATVGQFAIEPGATNVIPGQATLSLDLRHAENAVCRAKADELRAIAAEIAARRGLAVDFKTIMETPAVACDPGLTAVLEQAILAIGETPLRLVSGAGHDAVPLSRRMPVAMLFVRCKDGISHNPAESISAEDAATAVRVLTEAIRLLAANHAT